MKRNRSPGKFKISFGLKPLKKGSLTFGCDLTFSGATYNLSIAERTPDDSNNKKVKERKTISIIVTSFPGSNNGAIKPHGVTVPPLSTRALIIGW